VTYSVKVGNELYVYVRGRLVYKRWLDTDVSVTFHVAPAGERWNTDRLKRF
jgi:hypothetical protein